MYRRSDSPDNKHIDNSGHGRAKAVHTHRARERDGGEKYVENDLDSNKPFIWSSEPPVSDLISPLANFTTDLSAALIC